MVPLRGYEEGVRRLLGEGKKTVLLNVAGVSDLDSSGISELVSSFKTVDGEAEAVSKF